MGLAGALDCAAQAYSGEEMCEKTIRICCALVATHSEQLALFIYAPRMDMLGSALVYITIDIEIGGCGCESNWEIGRAYARTVLLSGGNRSQVILGPLSLSPFASPSFPFSIVW